MGFDEFLRIVAETKDHHPNWRYGQALFNTLATVRPDLAERLRTTPLDPFHVTDEQVLASIVEELRSMWA